MSKKKYPWWSRPLLFIAGMVLAGIFVLLRLTGRIKIIHPERFPWWTGGLLIAANHPSMWEPLMLGAMFWIQYLVSLKKWAPWSTPDKANFEGRWKWLKKIFGQIMILIPRGKLARKELVCVMRRMEAVLRSKRNLIIFPEGGRTSSETDPNKIVTSKKGHKLRELKPGIRGLAIRANAKLILVWVHGSDKVWPRNARFLRLRHQVTIVIGEQIDPNTVTDADIQARLLALADEV